VALLYFSPKQRGDGYSKTQNWLNHNIFTEHWTKAYRKQETGHTTKITCKNNSSTQEKCYERRQWEVPNKSYED